MPLLFVLLFLVLLAAGGRAVFCVGLARNERALALMAYLERILLVR